MTSEIPSWVRIGMKVVCICNDAETAKLYRERGLGERHPVNRGVYTIRSTFFSSVTGILCVRLVEIRNPIRSYAGGRMEGGFAAEAFRPLVTRSQEQDVAIFRPILDQVPVDA